jgi:rubredoxin
MPKAISIRWSWRMTKGYYRCMVCGYVYSPTRGEPYNRISAGTEFDDLPDTYVCPICGQQGKGMVRKSAFEPWAPTRYLCDVCGYIYDEKKGEPYRGIPAGTRFSDLPKEYVCPICGQMGLRNIHADSYKPILLA